MSDAGGDADAVSLTLQFDDNALSTVPDSGPLVSNEYRPADYETGDVLPAPAPTGPYSASLAVFNSFFANGTWSLYAYDDAAGDVGNLAGGWCLFLETDFMTRPLPCSALPLTIPSGAPATTSGPAGPYPSSITISDLPARARVRTLFLNNLTHSYPDDLDVLLVGPTGQAAIVMSDVGGNYALQSAYIGISDDATSTMPDTGPLTSTSYQPTNIDTMDSFPSPAPPPEYWHTLYDFTGLDPNGTWSLYVVDDTGGDYGSLGSWCLDFEPYFPVGEVTNVRWQAGTKDTLLWDPAANAELYVVHRGVKSDLPLLLTGTSSACVASIPLEQRAFLYPVPAPGTMYWYLVVGEAPGEDGPAGWAYIGGIRQARILSDTHPGCFTP